MGGEWKEATLAELSTDVAYGYTESATDQNVGPRFLRITDIQNGVVDWKTVPYCPISKSDLAKYRLERGDIVVARTGNSTGENYIFDSDEEAVFASYLIRFKIASSKVEPRFVWYSMRAPNWWGFINGSKTGSAQAGANAKVLGRFPLRLPPLPEQKAIAGILGALDDKIELNRRMNETLESMARAIFKSWFVDFDPVRAKMDGQQPAGMNPETAALFSDSFEDSELGQIPKGWEVGSLSQFADLQTLSVSPGSEPLRVWEHYSIPAFDDGKQPARELGSEIKSNKYVVPANCILVSKLNPRFPRVWFPDIDDAAASICSTEFMPFVPRKPEWRSFLHETVWSDSFQAEIQSRATGTTGSRQRVKPKEVAEIPIVIPSESVTDALAQLTSPLHIRQLANIRASKTLANLRDTLLPKLLSGELRVPEAEKQVEEVA